jgi:hypothetical protein
MYDARVVKGDHDSPCGDSAASTRLSSSRVPCDRRRDHARRGRALARPVHWVHDPERSGRRVFNTSPDTVDILRVSCSMQASSS